MPKIVDVEKHRNRIARAAWRLVSTQGLDAVSLRSVASEAGVSMGQVQHYFSTKNDLLFAAVSYSYQRIEEKLEEKLAEKDATPADVLIALYRLLLGEDEEVRDAVKVNVAFGARSRNEDRVQELLTEGDKEIIELGVAVITRAQKAGHVDSAKDPLSESRLLFAAATGLSTEVAIYQGSPKQAKEILDYHLGQLGLADTTTGP